jgi:hypothetical protein
VWRSGSDARAALAGETCRWATRILEFPMEGLPNYAFRPILKCGSLYCECFSHVPYRGSLSVTRNPSVARARAFLSPALPADTASHFPLPTESLLLFSYS